MKFAAFTALILSSFVVAAPTTKRQADLGVTKTLEGVCAKIGGTMITQTVCQTFTGTDISVAAAKDGGLAKVTVSGKGLLAGASITVPVGSLEDVLGQLGLNKRDLGVRETDIDVGSAGLVVRDLDQRETDIDVGSAGLVVRETDIDVGSAGLVVRETDIDVGSAGLVV